MTALFFSFVLSLSAMDVPPQSKTTSTLLFQPDWTPGMVVLETDDTVACILRYNQLVPEGLLQVREGETILTLSVRDVKSFSFYDLRRERYRKFYTLSVPVNGGLSREMFFEYIYGNDKVSILNHKTMGLARGYMEYTPFKQPIPINKPYFLNCRTGELLPVTAENALSLLDKKKLVKDFIEENHIRFRKMSDYVRIFEYDQSL